MDGFVQVTFEHTVQLEPLPCSDTQRAIGIECGQFVLDQVLLGCQHAAGNARAYHKLVRFLSAGCLTHVSRITVLLLINSGELEQLHLRLGEMRSILAQFLSYLPTQVLTLQLDLLHLASYARPQISQAVHRLFVIRHYLQSLLKYLHV